MGIGLFRVCGAKKKKTEGTAFAVDVLREINMYYVLTAYHVISEILATGDDIILFDENNRSLSATYKHELKALSEYSEIENDFAVLEVETSIDYSIYKVVDYRTISPSTACSIRGAMDHFETVFTRITCTYEGPEKPKESKNKSDILQLNRFSEFCINDGQYVPTQSIIMGASGGPVLVYCDNKEYCIGILAQIGQDTVTPIRYAVPAIYAAKDITNIKTEILGIDIPTVSARTYLDSLFDNDFSFSDDEEDRKIWNKLSNSFFAGNPIDIALGNIIVSDEFEMMSAEIKCALYYYYARLLYKRGRHRIAKDILNAALSNSNSISTDSQAKLKALIHGRELIETVGVHNLQPKTIRIAADEIENTKVSTIYKDYEIASMYGKGLMNLFKAVEDLSDSQRDEVKQIFLSQKELHQRHPNELKKQTVVITSVEWYIELWNADNNYSISDIMITIEKGFEQAALLKNNIFYVQCLIATVIAWLIEGKNDIVIKLCIIIAKIMRRHQLSLNHEGIYQLLNYITKRYSTYYSVLIYVYNNPNANTLETVAKLSTLDVNLNGRNWKSVIEESLNLYKILYENDMSPKTLATEPYSVGYRKLMIYFGL